MPTQLKPNVVEDALVQALTQALPNVNVAALTERDVSEEGTLIVTPPAVLVMFDSETLVSTRDVTATTYQGSQRHLIICGARDLGSPGAERGAAKQLVSDVRNALAGLRLNLPDDGMSTMPTVIAGVERFQFDKNGTW